MSGTLICPYCNTTHVSLGVQQPIEWLACRECALPSTYYMGAVQYRLDAHQVEKYRHAYRCLRRLHGNDEPNSSHRMKKWSNKIYWMTKRFHKRCRRLARLYDKGKP